MTLSVSAIIFYILATFILVSSFLAVTSLKIFRSAIYLLFTMIGVAGLYFWMSYEFIAAVQIIVYVGGIVVLIIFAIFLTHHVGSKMDAPKKMSVLFSGAAVLLAFVLSFMVIFKNQFTAESAPPVPLTVDRIGYQLLSLTEHGYILPFEEVSMLLLAAMVGCIVIALKPAIAGLEKPAEKKQL